MNIKAILAGVAVAVLCMAAPAVAAEPVNLNTATLDELSASPFCGPELAAKIVEYRENIGDFASYEELKELEGVNDTVIKKLSEGFVIEGVEAFDCNC
jgi:competence protein ComEA